MATRNGVAGMNASQEETSKKDTNVANEANERADMARMFNSAVVGTCYNRARVLMFLC